MKNIKKFILEHRKSYIELAKEWWESIADIDSYNSQTSKNKEAEELGITDGEYKCLCDWCDWLYDEYQMPTYSLWIDGPKANGTKEWHEAIDWLLGAVYRNNK